MACALGEEICACRRMPEQALGFPLQLICEHEDFCQSSPATRSVAKACSCQHALQSVALPHRVLCVGHGLAGAVPPAHSHWSVSPQVMLKAHQLEHAMVATPPAGHWS